MMDFFLILAWLIKRLSQNIMLYFYEYLNKEAGMIERRAR